MKRAYHGRVVFPCRILITSVIYLKRIVQNTNTDNYCMRNSNKSTTTSSACPAVKRILQFLRLRARFLIFEKRSPTGINTQIICKTFALSAPTPLLNYQYMKLNPVNAYNEHKGSGQHPTTYKNR